MGQGEELLPHNLICPLFLQSLIVASGDAPVELGILHSIYSCCVFEQFYHVPAYSPILKARCFSHCNHVS